VIGFKKITLPSVGRFTKLYSAILWSVYKSVHHPLGLSVLIGLKEITLPSVGQFTKLYSAIV